MDSIVSTALSEICSQATNGILLKDLWPTLHQPLTSSGLHLCDGVKTSIWAGLLNIPGLQFQSQHASSFSPQDPSIQTFQQAESLKLKIVAPQHLRNCFVGLHEGDSGISDIQRRTLERLAIARTNGITQNQLAKEFNMKGNNIFYVLRHLESRGLAVRQSTILRTKENATEGEDGCKNVSIVNTNLIHLYRYAKHLSPQQRLEITKFDSLETLGIDADGSTSVVDELSGEGIKDNVHVKDYMPAMKDVCDLLDQADEKVLVVSDIKQGLNYRRTPGHRSWRNICNRLKDARLVEEFTAKVNDKPVSCLRLLKKFDPKNLQLKGMACSSDDVDMHQTENCGRRGKVMDQILELPIEHQIYDMVDAEGPKGITVTEVCKRLGLSNKKYYTRLLNMFKRFGMQLLAENRNRTLHYRVWTSRNFTNGSANVDLGKADDVLEKGTVSMSRGKDLVLHKKSDAVLSTSKDDFMIPGETGNGQTQLEHRFCSAGDGETTQTLISGNNTYDIVPDIVDADFHEEHDLVCVATESKVAQSDTASSSLLKPSILRSNPRYPCLTLTAATTQREQRILQRLQEDKFILTVELYRWLESLEKDKHTTMARKTLTRTLNKLQQEGHCKCIQVSVPSVTNCGRSRTTEVVLDKSLQSLPPEVFGQLHERLRSFDMQSRGQGLARTKDDKTLPVLTNIKRTPNHERSDNQAVKAEAMRANGFVCSKMVRAKLLHNFLWKYVSSTPDWDGALSSGRHGYDLKNPHSTCKLFALDVAIKAMPLELFLQVAGSTEKFEYLFEGCKRDLCLADLPSQEYKCLMNTQATGRLSWVIDILRRLKLIRMVTDGPLQDGGKIPCAILTHAMELKPFIEEPLSNVSLSFGANSVDLRPRIRHDFILSKLEAVDIYWKTLEYCYATADPRAAVHAFPGSSVQEVFLYRSWASVRVMTAEQRAELLKRIVRDDPDKKISFADCVKIARDLNLTLEQVLRVSNDKRQSRLNRFRKDVISSEQEFQPIKSNCFSASQKRKKSLRARSSKRLKYGTIVAELDAERNCTLSDNDCQNTEKQATIITQYENHDIFWPEHDEDRQLVPIEEDGEEKYEFITQCTSRWKSTRQPKFSWTEMSDRQLIIEYVRHRAALGARFHRTDWVSLPNLPAPPDTCRRRMAQLNSIPVVRRAVMSLCNLLGERYAKHLAETQQKVLLISNDTKQIVQEFSPEEGRNQQWDDFDDRNIKMALDEVLRCKQMAKLEASRRGGLAPEKEWSDANLDAQPCNSQDERELTPSTTAGAETGNCAGKRKRSSCHRLPGKFLKLLNEGISIHRRAYESLAVANAVELLKLVFLSTSTAVEVPNLLADTLRRYSEHDLFAAFNYLREKKFMVGGNGSQPFVLSQRFLHSISSSPFPSNTGKRAAKFVKWLQERENYLMEDVVHLYADLQCGEIFHMLALVSSGELCMSPCLPEEGIGEPEENRSSKRKADEDEWCAEDVKKVKSQDGEVVSRREKGFPGIEISLSRVTLPVADAVDFFRSEKVQPSSSLLISKDKTSACDVGTGGSLSPSNPLKPNYSSGNIVSVEMPADGSVWKSLSTYSEHLLSTFSNKELDVSFNSELFKKVYSSIRKAGDQGLSLEEISKVIPLKGKFMTEYVVDILQVFGLAVKVNAYNCVHVVGLSFRSKYFLTTVDSRYQDLKQVPYVDSPRMTDNMHPSLPQEYHSTSETSVGGDLHKVTILNLPEEVSHLSSQVQIQSNESVEECLQAGVSTEGITESQINQGTSSRNSHSCRPILPWLNGDGTTNMIVYKGLRRRVLGIVMQSPGILEDNIIRQMDVLNPQSCRKLLELMVLDNHLFVRKMHQTIHSKTPVLLQSLFGGSIRKSESICREHFFANPLSTNLL